MTYFRIRIYNDIDQTSYEIVYVENEKLDTIVTTDKILMRIANDVVKISLQNKTRSNGLNFDSAKITINENFTEMRLFADNIKCYGHLHIACTHYFDL